MHGAQDSLRVRPQSRLEFRDVFWIQMASSTLPFMKCGSLSRISAASQAGLCWLSHAWTATPFFLSLLLTAYIQHYSGFHLDDFELISMAV